jgi:hypothetical protein
VRNLTAVDFGGDFGGGCGDEGDAGDDAVSASGEQAQHAGGVGGAFGLAEDVVVEGYGGVGAEDGQVSEARSFGRLRTGSGAPSIVSWSKTAWAFSRARRVT